MITKKDIPLDLLRLIEPIFKENMDVLKFKKEENTYYSFWEKDESSQNYFKIYIDISKKSVRLGGRQGYGYQWKPRDNTNTSSLTGVTNLKELESHLRAWIKRIRELNNIESVHDDNFLKQYSDFYYNEFKIFDKDADVSPFNPEQQEIIELYIDSLSFAISKSSEPEIVPIKTEIIGELEQLKNDLNILTKNQVMKTLTKVFGKLYSVSKKFTKEIIKEASKVLIKKLIEVGIEYAPKLIESVSKLLH